jgi:hypothetical protein
MIEIECDKCERAFQVDDSEAGGKVECPMCGDVNRVPETAAARPVPAAVRRADARPSADEAEKEIRVVRPAMFRAHPFRFLLILALIAGGVVGGIAGLRMDKPWLGWLSLAPVVFGLLWLAKWWITAHLWIKISITNKRTIRHEGIIRRHSTEVLHDHVRSVDIKQNFMQRIMKVGYIGIDSAGQDDIEIEIRDIPGPYEIKKLIDRYRSM